MDFKLSKSVHKAGSKSTKTNKTDVVYSYIRNEVPKLPPPHLKASINDCVVSMKYQALY